MRILVYFLTRSLGDTIGAMPAVSAFQKRENCDVFVDCGWPHILKDSYPNLSFIKGSSRTDYDKAIPVNYHFEYPLQEGFARDLGFENWTYHKPLIDFIPGTRPIKGKYVALGIQSTAQAKYWNYPDGWDKLCRLLRNKKNITPVCIDQYESFGTRVKWNFVPKSAVKRLDNSIEDAMNYIYHAEFFMGVSSGLAWVAHAMGKKVLMISGTTNPWNEFDEDCLRIHNDKVCHGCFHEVEKWKFNPEDWMWCPLHRGTSRQFECTKSIAPSQVFFKLEEAGWV